MHSCHRAGGGEWRIANWALRMAGAMDVGVAGVVNWLVASVLGAGDGTGLLPWLAVMGANSSCLDAIERCAEQARCRSPSSVRTSLSGRRWSLRMAADLLDGEVVPHPCTGRLQYMRVPPHSAMAIPASRTGRGCNAQAFPNALLVGRRRVCYSPSKRSLLTREPESADACWG
jgi:hypothetical protein